MAVHLACGHTLPEILFLVFAIRLRAFIAPAFQVRVSVSCAVLHGGIIATRLPLSSLLLHAALSRGILWASGFCLAVD